MSLHNNPEPADSTLPQAKKNRKPWFKSSDHQVRFAMRLIVICCVALIGVMILRFFAKDTEAVNDAFGFTTGFFTAVIAFSLGYLAGRDKW